MDDEDLDELYEDVVDKIQEVRRDLKKDEEAGKSLDEETCKLRTRLEACERAMREHGCVYCKELWTQEDNGARYRRREDSSSSEEEQPAEPAKTEGSTRSGSGASSRSCSSTPARDADETPAKKRAKLTPRLKVASNFDKPPADNAKACLEDPGRFFGGAAEGQGTGRRADGGA
eukprot:TRINITY_DN20105_c0_g1_i1.p3 TRINITY_DN20105_c0_g1~~TRINITY_DN20105_c0_g1_i1.p3  ORF type:complete len:174 (+),score=60.26 TRINITY_DN20105_c0_g1_i1:282-803(+)